MLFAHRWIAVVLCLMLSGCTVYKNARRTLFGEPRAYFWEDDEERSKEIYRYWADNAWNEHCAAFPELCDAKSYAYGFKDGFVDFVYAGGTGAPPPVPPRRFWNADLRAPEGHAAANGWFEGYREGTRVARNGGFREQATLHSSFHFGAMKADGLSRDQETLAAPIEKLAPPPESLPPPVLETPRLENSLPENPLLENPLPQNDSARQRPAIPENLLLASEATAVHHMLPLSRNATSLQPREQRNSRTASKRQKEKTLTNRDRNSQRKHESDNSSTSDSAQIKPAPLIQDQRVVQTRGARPNHPTPHRKSTARLDLATELKQMPPIDDTATSLSVMSKTNSIPEKAENDRPSVDDHSLPEQKLNTIELKQINQGSSFHFVY